ncbi:patched family domain-containing protein [Ditylenchus destructor]|uniref:Patched family domain-containing protein n=1 Tax=Ditylenchus destructor TaxID=166010 RepID=A0AAD4NBZ0_9BILA|nr:patched family domain-containing protein [Ditylenchus destructor]
MRSFDCIEKPLSLFFYRYGRYISKNPWPFIVFPVLFTLASSTGFLYLYSITDAIYLFTPVNAQSKFERQTVHDLWPLVNGTYIPGRAVTQSREVQVTVRTTDDGNILEKPYSEAIYRLDMLIQNHVKVHFQNRTYRYQDLCLGRNDQGCPGNKHIQVISELFQHGVDVTYPTVQLGNVRGYIGSSLGGVTVRRGKGESFALAGAKAWFLVYHLQFYPSNVSYISGLWEKEFQRLMEHYPKDPFIKMTYFHSQTLAEELKRNADSLVPRFVLAFAILMLFSVFCNISTCDNSYFIDWAVSKPILAILGVVNAGMGILTAIGLLNWLSVPYNDIVGVMPFLVVAVGVDNMFLMVAAIRRTNRAFSVGRRMGEAMSDAAISMMITALTDAFSFGVGAITTIPAVQIFCIYTCAAITATFVYQITFFAGLLAMAIQWETDGLHCIFLKPTIPEHQTNECGVFYRLFWMGSRPDPNPENVKHNLKESNAALFFQNWFGPVLMQPVVRFLAILWFFIYMAFAIYGCMQLREGLEPINLLVEDSYAIPHYKVLEKYFWHYGATVQVVVNNAPDFRIPEERRKIKEMVHDFANTRHTIGDNSVQFWMNEMERYYATEISLGNVTDEISNEFYGLTRHFMTAKRNEYWPDDVKWVKLDSGGIGIKAFRFLVGMRDISTSVQQQDATATLRAVASKYPQYNVTTFMPLWLFTDQYALVVPNTVQNIAIAMLVMVVIAVLLIPQPSCALWVALAIASIDVGVIGYMTLWNVNLDAISMITIIMSIGFSVDYSAHITYGYVTSTEKNPTDRIRHALGALGWPLTQGAFSTILTVFLAISLGLLHGLVFLPVTLSLFVRGACITSGSAEKKIFPDLDLTTQELRQWKTKDVTMKIVNHVK